MHHVGFISISAEDLRGLITGAIEEALANSAQVVAASAATIESELLTRKDVARKLHLSLVTLRELEKRGELIPVRATRRVLYRDSDIERYLNRGKEGRGHGG